MFRPFSRLGAETTEIEGPGNGLTVAKQLAEMMTGGIGFETADLHDRLMELKGTVLYIENNPANARLLEKATNAAPEIKMIAANSGETGLQPAEEKKPDVVILDINLPEINGYDVMEQLRLSDGTKAIPVIALSARATREHIERGEQAGFLRYLTKPVVLAELVDAIAEAIGDRP